MASSSQTAASCIGEPTLLYGHRPVCQVDLDVMPERGIGCGLISGLLRAEAAGPDGIRQERPHLGRVLQAQGRVQVCVLAVRPVLPSLGINPSNLPVPRRFNVSYCYAGLTLT